MIAALALAVALGTSPLACPSGAERRGAGPPDGTEEWCERADPLGRPLREGPARTWYDGGAPWTEAAYRDGLLEGPFVERHRNGRFARVGAYARGLRVGRWVVSSEQGSPEEESTWRAGVLDGPFTAWFPSGTKRTEGRHCGGAQCGIWKTWDESGRLVGSVEYADQGPTP